MKKHTIREFSPTYQRAYLSNGFVGFRIGKNPFREVSCLMQGYTAQQNIDTVQSYCNMPAPEVHFMIDGDEADFETVEQSNDFSFGELETVGELICGDKKIDLTARIVCSRTSPTIVLNKYEFRTEHKCNITMQVVYKERGSSHLIRSVKKSDEDDGIMLFETNDKSSSAAIGIYMIAEGSENFKKYSIQDYGWLNCCLEADVAENTDFSVSMFTSLIPGIMHSEPHNQVLRMLKLAEWDGFESMWNKNIEAWKELWKGRIHITGASERWQDVIDASYYYLISSMSSFQPMGVAPYGLACNNYEGHTFWDTESFMFMVPLFCAPDIAKEMLEYRYERVDAARRNAKLNGYMGIQFPWQSGATGEEVTVPLAGQAGGAGEQHVNFDVALAFDAYVRVSGDYMFMKERAWPVINGIAEWIESRVTKTGRGYEILHVTGIDEESDNVNNDSYTNIMSARILRLANCYGEKLGYPASTKRESIASQMFIPISKDGTYLEQYENNPVRDDMASTAMMAFFPYGYHLGEKLDKGTYKFYMDHGMERYLSYPMLSGFLGLFPSWLGDRKLALDYYEKSNLRFFVNPYWQSVEWAIDDMSNPPGWMCSNFLTGRGSLLAGLIMGLTRMNIWHATDSFGDSFESWFEGPISLPDTWDEIVLERIYICGRPAKIIAKQGAPKAELIWLED